MILEHTMCYSHLLYILEGGPVLERAISKIEFSTPDIQHEGMAGYVETKVKFHIRDLTDFANLFEAWYSLTDTMKIRYYGKAKGLECA